MHNIISLSHTQASHFFISKEIKKQASSIKRLTYHAPRCKKEGARIKILALIAYKSLYVKELVKKIDSEVSGLVSDLLP